MSGPIKACIIIVFLAFLAFGFFMLDIPHVNSDELWETSRGYYMMTHHHPGDPMLPVEISPFFSSVQYIGWKSWFMGTLKSGSAALTMSLVALDPWHAMRLNTFLWSILVCIFTYFLSKKMGLNHWLSLLSAAILIAIPEFFQQVHLERAEIMICASYIFGLILYQKIFTEEKFIKRIWLFICGIYSWLPSLMIHPSAAIIPVTFGILYLVFEKKNILSVNTLIIGAGLLGGFLFFNFITSSMTQFALNAGGHDVMTHHGPPILKYGFRQLFRMPLIFYNKFIATSLISKLISLILFIVAIVYLFFRTKKHSDQQLKKISLFLLIAIVIPLFVLMMVSGSIGNYNIIVAPLIAIVFAGMIQLSLERQNVNLKLVAPVLLLLCLSSNAIGMRREFCYTQDVKKVNEEIKSVIPESNSVFGIALYYLPFKDQNYYSASCFSEFGGKPDQSFAETMNVLHVNYIIVDDGLVSLVTSGRSKQWTDSMFVFLNQNTKMIKEISVDTYIGLINLDKNNSPAQWTYSDLERNRLRRIRIYKIANG